MIARILAFVQLELAGGWRRPLPNFMFAILALLTIGLVAGNVKISIGSTDVGGAKTAINSGLNLAFVDVAILSVVLPFFAALACGMPLLVDGDRKISRLLLATPLTHGEYAAARFLAAAAGLGAVLAAWLVVQMLACQLWPLDTAQSIRVGFSPGNYLLPPILFGLPLVVFTGGVSLWTGVRTRQPVVVFALPLVIFLGGGFFLWSFNPEWLPRWADRLMQAIDPAGFRWFHRTFVDEQRSVAFLNTAPLVPDLLFLASRCGFVALGLLGVFAAGRRLRREERGDRRVGAPEAVLAMAAAVPQPEPAAEARAALPTTTVSPPGLVATTCLTLGRETAALLKSPGIWLFGPLILLQVNRVDGSRGGDAVVTYQRAGWVFWMLRGLMGEEPLLAGLRDFIATWRDGVVTDDGLDFPLVEDLLASLRRHAPDAAAFDDFVGRWILGKDLPELVVREAAVEKAGAGYRVTGELANVGTGRAEVRVRVERRKPDAEGEPSPVADAIVPVSAEAAGRFEIATDFVPERIVVDPEVELLFTGRKRCETPLSKR